MDTVTEDYTIKKNNNKYLLTLNSRISNFNIGTKYLLSMTNTECQYYIKKKDINTNPNVMFQLKLKDKKVKNLVKDLYSEFTADQISNKISELISDDTVKAKVKTIFQPIENLHKACPKNLGDWYFTGNYPTDGGNRVVNRAFINFYEGNKERAY